MRITLLIFGWLLSLLSWGQVEIDGNIDFSNAPVGEQHVSGLGQPTTASSLVSLNAAVAGVAHWCSTVSMTQDTIILQPSIEVSQLSNGLLLRFIADTLSFGDTWIKLATMPAAPLRDKDKKALTRGRFYTQEVLQIQWQDSVFILTNPPASECPAGYLRLTEALCIQQSDNQLADWFEANDACEKQGSSLCTFAEYIHACRTLDNDLIGLFNNWEWIDDTSDHTHTADQVGRFTCSSNRSRGATHQDFANYRCCYLIR